MVKCDWMRCRRKRSSPEEFSSTLNIHKRKLKLKKLQRFNASFTIKTMNSPGFYVTLKTVK